jgi:uncharacterized protein YbjT (DUF2867 family)
MKILLLGANGFIGRTLLKALLKQGMSVIACVRSSTQLPKHDRLEVQLVDLSKFTQAQDWAPYLTNIDAVINCAGILQSDAATTFDDIHYLMPMALAKACQHHKVDVFIQLSAMGSPSDGAFVRSKHAGDDAVLQYLPNARIVRPSVVFSLRGSYGGTTLMRAIASLPWIPLPKTFCGSFQPILLDDLIAVMCRLISYQGHETLFYPSGPDTYALRDFLSDIREWLGWAPPRFIHYPDSIFQSMVRLNQLFRWVPLNKTLLNMMKTGNHAPLSEFKKVESVLGVHCSSLKDSFKISASFVQDRWHSRIYWMTPISIFILFFVWIMSAISGFLAEPYHYEPLLNSMFIPKDKQSLFVLASSSWDLILAISLLFSRFRHWTLWLMMISTIAYTSVLGIMAPSLWWDLPGGMIKNAAVLGVITIALMIRDKR